MILNSNTAAMVEADMAKQIHTSRQGAVMSSKGVVTTKMLATHTPSRRATPTLHNPPRHNKPTEDDSNRGATETIMVKLRQRMQVVQARPAVATVRPMPAFFWDEN